MDALGAALAVVALGVYPGAAYLTVVSGAAAWAGGVPRGSRRLERADVLAMAAATGATALAPLPGTPAAALPPVAGAAPDAIVVGLLAALAVAAPSGGPWSRMRTAGVVAAGAGALVLAAAAGSLSLLSIDALPGTRMAAARALAAAALVAVAPLAGDLSGTAPRSVRSIVTTMVVLVGASLAVPSGISGGSVALAAAAVTAFTVSYAVALRLGRPLLAWLGPLLGGAGVALSAAAVAVAAVAPR